MTYEVGDNVLVNVYDNYQVGMITAIKRRSNKVLYTVHMESGSVFYDVSTNNQKSTIFIDRKRTKSLIDKINTNLSYEVIRRNVTNNPDDVGDTDIW